MSTDHILARLNQLQQDLSNMLPARRKPVAIAVGISKYGERTIVALCDDGTIWDYWTGAGEWSQLPAIPQPIGAP